MRQLFHEMALFTNENFFTNQTVYGKGKGDIKPVLRPSNPYLLPFAQESGDGWEYEPTDFTFYRTIAGNSIKMCKDRYYFADVVPTKARTNEAYVDLDVAKSQAKVLLSNLIGIGPNVIKRYIPEIEVKILDADQTFGINGYVDIKTSVEYPVKKEYKSIVRVVNQTSGDAVNVEASNGYFSTDELEFSEGDRIRATISVGGLIINSEVFTAGGSRYKEWITKSNNIFMGFTLRSVKFSDGTTDPLSFASRTEEDGVNWDNVDYQLNGQTLTIHKVLNWNENNGESTGSETHDFIFNFSTDFSKIESMNFNMTLDAEEFSYSRTVNGSFTLENIPYEYIFGNPGQTDGFIRYWIDNDEMEVGLTSLNYSNTHYDKIDEETTTKTANLNNVDWSVATNSEPDICTLLFKKVE